MTGPAAPGYTPSALSMYRRLLAYSGRHWPVFVFSAVAMGLQAATVTSFAVLVQPLIDGTFVERDPGVIRWMPLAVVVLFAVRGLGTFVSTYGMEWIGRQVVTALRQELFDKLLRLPSSYFDQQSGALMLSRFAYNAEQVSESATRALTIVVRDTLTLTGLTVWMLYLSPRLSLFVLLIGPPVAFLIRVTSRMFRRYSERIQDSMGDVTRVAEEVIRGQKEVKIYAGATYESQRFGRDNEANRRAFHEAGAGQGGERSGDSATRRGRSGGDHLRGRPAGQRVFARSVQLFRGCDVAADGSAQATHRHQRRIAARHCRVAEHLRGSRSARRGSRRRRAACRSGRPHRVS